MCVHTHTPHALACAFPPNRKSEVKVLASAHFIGGGGGMLVYYNAKLFLTTTATDIQPLLCRGSGLVKWLLSAEMNGVT